MRVPLPDYNIPMQRMKTLITDLLAGKRLSRLRTIVQGCFGLFCLWAGYRFYLFFLWATAQTTAPVPRPPAVEGFLPISGLLGLKRLVLSGHYDMIHPAGLTILLAALTIALLLRKGFCGWICPVGFTSNLAEKIGKRLKILWRPPFWFDIPMLALKYLLLLFFSYLILWKMNLAQIEAFHRSPYNMVADAKMLLFFLEPSGLAGAILLFLVLVSFVIRNFWCRYLCPYGALLGILALASPLKIKRDQERCIDCKKCEKTCPGAILITEKKTVRANECIGCMECVSVCPVENCLTLGAPASKKVHPLLLPAGVLTIFLAFWLIALFTGHWHSTVPPEVLQKFYSTIGDLGHP